MDIIAAMMLKLFKANNCDIIAVGYIGNSWYF